MMADLSIIGVLCVTWVVSKLLQVHQAVMDTAEEAEDPHWLENLEAERIRCMYSPERCAAGAIPEGFDE